MRLLNHEYRTLGCGPWWAETHFIGQFSCGLINPDGLPELFSLMDRVDEASCAQAYTIYQILTFFFLCLLLHLISTKPSLLNLKNSLHSTAEFIHDQSSVSTTHDNITSSFPWTSYGDVTQVEKKENAVTCGNQKSLKLIH